MAGQKSRRDQDYDAGVIPLADYSDYGKTMMVDPEGHGYLQSVIPMTSARPQEFVLSKGAGEATGGASASMNPRAAPMQATRKKTPEELLAEANAMQQRMDAEHAASLGAPTTVGPRPMSEGFQFYGVGSNSPSAPQAMLQNIQPVSYNYVPGVGENPERTQYGITAQDLEKTPMGASVVRNTPMGKVIDVPKATGVQFAALADLQRQNDELRQKLQQIGGGAVTQAEIDRVKASLGGGR